MKVEIIDYISGNQEIETKSGLEVYSTNDKLSIEPCYSNLIYLKTRK